MPENTIAYPDQESCMNSIQCSAGVCNLVYETVDVSEFTEQPEEFVALVSTVHVGDMLTMTVRGESESVSVSQDPGLPISMSRTSGDADHDLVLQWRPRVGQEGFVHEIVVEKPSSTKRLRIRIPVAPEAMTWVHPRRNEPMMIQTTVGSTVETDVRCQSNYQLMQLAVKQLDDGFDFRPGMEPRLFDAISRMPQKASASAGHLTFTAIHGHEGTTSMACFGCMSSTFMMEQEACVTVRVSLCKYATKPGDTLLSITRMYHQNNNWRRLWNINPSIVPDPQHVMAEGTVLDLGPIYRIQDGDSLANIAGRFDTTIRNLLEVNQFIIDEEMVKSGEELCITPCTNQPTPSMDMKFAY
mmetsp:Transcript_14791/g.23034  ORF Transcript_14791/g.23034 Transcript_14791/m.23034 type:complete len:356 (-) Transcript_14791:650-1717(-)